MTEKKTAAYRPSLALYVVWHPGRAKEETRPPEKLQLAERLHASFYRPPQELLYRGLGIPVFFRGVPASPEGAPAPIPLDEARHTVVILLIDDHFLADKAWRQFAQETAREVTAHPGRHLLVPVQLGPGALDLGNLNAARLLPESSEEERARHLITVLTHELCRLLLHQPPAHTAAERTPRSPPPVKLFLSHAKVDGAGLAKQFQEYLGTSHSIGVDSFFDTRDIPPGSDFAKEIEGNIERSALVAFQTDAYVSRPWCRREVLVAKRLGCPVVVVNAVQRAEERTFPYLGNTPSLRWDLHAKVDFSRDVLDLALQEVLRTTYTRFHLRSLQEAGWIPEDALLQPRPPELITPLDAPSPTAPGSGLVVYPDPPLGQEELEVLAAARPRLRFATPTALSMGVGPAGDPPPLTGRKLALSISEGDDLPRLGLSAFHLKAAYVEFARSLLAAGATLLYGGNLRTGGFTEVLMDLVLAHRRVAHEMGGSIENFLAWPETEELSVGQRARFQPQLQFEPVQECTGLSQPELARIQKSLEQDLERSELPAPDRHVRARNLSAMREKMTTVQDARLVLGGKLRGFTGTLPGVIEEAYLAMRAGRPLYVIGGFGGCARAIAEALQGRPSPGLEAAAREPSIQALLEYRRSQPAPGGSDALTCEDAERLFREKGVAGLNNGLTDEENQRLFETLHVPEMLFLVMKGLASLPR